MLIETLSSPLVKALTRNSRAVVLSETWFRVTGTAPVDDTTLNREGIFDVPEGPVHPGIVMLPYCEGEPGGQWWMRLWGWRRFGKDVNTEIWIPYLLLEAVCVAGTEMGIEGRNITQRERFAASIGVTRGNAYVMNDTVSYAAVGLGGCQKFQFDIAQGSVGPAYGNCLWAKA